MVKLLFVAGTEQRSAISGRALVQQNILSSAGSKRERVTRTELVVSRSGDLGVVDVRSVARFEVY